MSGRGELPPIPSASSFNTERDMRGVRPGRTLEHKAQIDLRRSSYCETTSKTIKEEGEHEVEVENPLPEEPAAPKPGATRSGPLMSNLLQPKPVILTSKPVFSTLHQKRHEEGTTNGATDA